MKVRTKLLFKILNYHGKKLSALELEDVRKYFDKMSSAERKPKVQDVSEQLITAGGHSVKVRTYRQASNAPTILFFHGGGFVLGSLDSHDIVASLLCKQTGCSVVSVDYRLAPEHKYPAPVEDGLAVLEWIAQQQQLNHSQVFLAGDSAGGHIALNVAVKSSANSISPIKGVILMYPALDPTLSSPSMQQYAKGYFVSKENMEYFWKSYVDNVHDHWPLPDNSLKNSPPVLIQTAEHDILRDEAHDLADQLSKISVPNKYIQYKSNAHGFMQTPAPFSSRKQALRDIKNFIDQYKS
jgi:acetyl esterase